MHCERGHKFKATGIKYLPTPPRKYHRRHTSGTKQQKVIKQPDEECEYVNLQVMTSQMRDPNIIKDEETKEKTKSCLLPVYPGCPGTKEGALDNTRTKAVHSHVASSRKSSLRMSTANIHVASPRRLLRMFAERFNRKDRVSKSPMKSIKNPQVLFNKPRTSSFGLNSTGCGSMGSKSGLTGTSGSCQLSSANCSKTIELQSSGIVTELLSGGSGAENEIPAPSGSEQSAQCISLSELSSINRVTHTTGDEYSCCHLLDENNSMKYPQSSTPTLPCHPSSTPGNSTLSRIPIGDSLQSDTLQILNTDRPCGILTNPVTTVKRILSETFTVYPPAKTTPPESEVLPGIRL